MGDGAETEGEKSLEQDDGVDAMGAQPHYWQIAASTRLEAFGGSKRETSVSFSRCSGGTF